MPGMGELLIILLIVLLIFGAGKLPQIGEALGRSIKNFKRSSSGNDEIEVSKSKQIDESTRGELEDGNDGDDDIADAEVVVSKVEAKKA